MNDVLNIAKKSFGKTIVEATFKELEGNIGPDRLILTFDDSTHIVLYDDGQCCCENRYMATDDDLKTIHGAKLTNIELCPTQNLTANEEEGDYRDVQFLRIHTTAGIITIANYNEHNGYYGGFWLVCEEVVERGADNE